MPTHLYTHTHTHTLTHTHTYVIYYIHTYIHTYVSCRRNGNARFGGQKSVPPDLSPVLYLAAQYTISLYICIHICICIILYIACTTLLALPSSLSLSLSLALALSRPTSPSVLLPSLPQIKVFPQRVLNLCYCTN